MEIDTSGAPGAFLRPASGISATRMPASGPPLTPHAYRFSVAPMMESGKKNKRSMTYKSPWADNVLADSCARLDGLVSEMRQTSAAVGPIPLSDSVNASSSQYITAKRQIQSAAMAAAQLPERGSPPFKAHTRCMVFDPLISNDCATVVFAEALLAESLAGRVSGHKQRHPKTPAIAAA